MDAEGPPPSEPLTPSPYETPPPPPPRASRAKVTALVVAVLVALTAGGTVLVLRASNSQPSTETLVPGDVAAYVKISLHPSGQQMQAIQDLLSRFPSSFRDKVGSKLDDALEGALKDLGISYKKDMKPWVGDQIALAVRAAGAATSDNPSAIPNIVGIIPTTDASAAQKTLDRLKGRPNAPAFEVMGGVVYIGKTTADIDALRNAVTAGHTLADNPTYTHEHDRAGGDGLMFAYADLSKVGGAAGALPGDILGGAGLTGGKGIVAASLRAESEGLVLAGHSSVSSPAAPKGGTFKLLPSTPDDLLGSVSFYDLGGLVGNALKALGSLGNVSLNPVSTRAQQVPGLSEATQALKEIQQALGINLQKDLLPWLRGELSVVVGPVTTPPIPDIGIVIEPTDAAALGRTLSALKKHLAPLASSFGGKVTPSGDGLTVDIAGGPSIVVRTSANRVVIASSARYAARLLNPSGSTLGGDAVYKAAVDPSKPTVFQMFLRIDRVRTLVEALMKLSDPKGYADYEANVQPALKPLQALGMQVTINGADQDFRMVVTVAKP
ncbi:MAG: DUF3352 domain-containing protein [Actinomycetota bacterium]